MGTEKGQIITIENNNNKENKTFEDFKAHLKGMGLQTNRLTPDLVEFAEFDILHENQIKIEVRRPDGNLTRCYLTKSSDSSHDYVYLQIEANIKPDDINYGVESRGIFPVSIIGVGGSSHFGYHSHDSIDFITSNGGHVGITSDGTIEFDQGKF